MFTGLDPQHAVDEAQDDQIASGPWQSATMSSLKTRCGRLTLVVTPQRLSFGFPEGFPASISSSNLQVALKAAPGYPQDDGVRLKAP